MRAFCIEHPDEEISYYCFDCLANCICPECVIHGAHKNHDVLTVKKSFPIVRNKVRRRTLFGASYLFIIRLKML